MLREHSCRAIAFPQVSLLGFIFQFDAFMSCWFYFVV